MYKRQRILYIGNKGILESGSHDELMARHGLYYQLDVYKRQGFAITPVVDETVNEALVKTVQAEIAKLCLLYTSRSGHYRAKRRL